MPAFLSYITSVLFVLCDWNLEWQFPIYCTQYSCSLHYLSNLSSYGRPQNRCWCTEQIHSLDISI